MQVTFGAHWLRYSTPVEDLDAVQDAMPGEFADIERRGGFNQPMRVAHESGATVYFGDQIHRQPIVVDVPGEACERVPLPQLLDWCSAVGGRVTRVDLAADIEPADLATKRLIDMRRKFITGKCDTRIPPDSCDFFRSHREGGGRTLYVGSPSSEWFVRAYDKRGPLRIEQQWKPEKSTREHVPAMLRRYGAAGVWRAQAQARCIWPMPWFKQLLAGECADLQPAVKDPDDFERTLAALSEQYGPTIFALLLAGVPLTDVARRPSPVTRAQRLRWKSWAAQAAKKGYDSSKLVEEVKRCRRSK